MLLNRAHPRPAGLVSTTFRARQNGFYKSAGCVRNQSKRLLRQVTAALTVLGDQAIGINARAPEPEKSIRVGANMGRSKLSICGKVAVSGSLRATRRATTARYSSTAGRDKSARRSTPRRLPGLCAARARRPPARARRGRPVINNTLLDLFVSGIASMASRPTLLTR